MSLCHIAVVPKKICKKIPLSLSWQQKRNGHTETAIAGRQCGYGIMATEWWKPGVRHNVALAAKEGETRARHNCKKLHIFTSIHLLQWLSNMAADICVFITSQILRSTLDKNSYNTSLTEMSSFLLMLLLF